MQLSIDQLSYLKNQHEQEIIEMNKQLETLVGARNRYLGAKSTLTDIATVPEGNSMLVPLNSSLYIQGTVMSQSKVIVELGTGYFCEKTIPEAKELVDRKVS